MTMSNSRDSEKKKLELNAKNVKTETIATQMDAMTFPYILAECVHSMPYD